MARYFKVIEIDRPTFVKATGEGLGHYQQSIIPVDGNVFVAINDDYEDEFYVGLDCFDEDCKLYG